MKESLADNRWHVFLSQKVSYSADDGTRKRRCRVASHSLCKAMGYRDAPRNLPACLRPKDAALLCFSMARSMCPKCLQRMERTLARIRA